VVIVPYCITYPGTWIDLPDPQVAHELSGLLSLVESSLTEAAISLGAYIASRNVPNRRMPGPEAWQQRIDESRLYENQIRVERGISEYDFARRDEIRAEVDRRRLNAAFAAGILPEAYRHRMAFVHAKGFLTATHRIRLAIDQCTQFSAIETASTAACDAIDAALPKLKGVRDSSAHVDERVRGMARGKLISPRGGALFIENLFNDNFGGTMVDGNHGEVPVTIHAFEQLVAVVQDFLNKLPWRGSERVAPSL